jgi:hypothetical protein
MILTNCWSLLSLIKHYRQGSDRPLAPPWSSLPHSHGIKLWYRTIRLTQQRKKPPPSPSELTRGPWPAPLAAFAWAEIHSSHCSGWSTQRVRSRGYNSWCIPQFTHFSSPFNHHLPPTCHRVRLSRGRYHPCWACPHYFNHVAEWFLSLSFPTGVTIPFHRWIYRRSILRDCPKYHLLLAMPARRLAICR